MQFQSYPLLRLMSLSEGITLIGSNGQISIEYFISVKDENAGLLVTTPGAILLEATFFINVVSSLPDVVLDVKEIEQKQIVFSFHIFISRISQSDD